MHLGNEKNVKIKIPSSVLIVVLFISLIYLLYMGVELTTPTSYTRECINSASQGNVTFKKIDGNIYCIRHDGSIRTGFVTRNGKSYYFDKNGIMQIGVIKIGNSIFGFHQDGHQASGITRMNNHYYDFDDTAHSAITGFIKINNRLYYFGQDGKQSFGIQYINGKIYAFTGKEGASVTGWVNQRVTNYYIPDTHQILNGITTINNQTYRFENNRTLQGDMMSNGKRYSFTGVRHAALINAWSQNHQYYYGNDMSAVTDIQLIDGRYYRFRNNGKLDAYLGTKDEYETKLEQEQLQKVIQQASENQGNAGNFCVPDVGVNVRLYSCHMHVLVGDNSSQVVVDQQNSAAYFTDTVQPIIADHSNQGFSALANAKGKYAYLTVGSTTTRYICTGVNNGTNQATNLLYNGKSFIYNKIASLVAYTCNTSWRDILIFTFEPA